MHPYDRWQGCLYITGDKDLLTLGKFETVDILLPRDFAVYEDRLASG
jgi:predicted nucleic acid-binding protein